MMTTSKKIVLVSYICSITLTLIVIFGAILGYDTGNITTIAVLAWGEVAVSNAFYYKKAARENALKIAASLPPEAQATIDYNTIINKD